MAPFPGADRSNPSAQRQPVSLEEVVLAVEALSATEAALGQRRVAVAALEALAVPVAVQSLEDEAVQDVLVAAGTQWDLCRQRSPRGRGHRSGGLEGTIPPPPPGPGPRRGLPSLHTLVPSRLELRFRECECGAWKSSAWPTAKIQDR